MDRRTFVAATASLAAGAGGASPADHAPAPPASADDPLGVRADFPIVGDRIYLNSAYIAPIPAPVVAAGTAFLERKAMQRHTVRDLLRVNEETRNRFARLINAGPDEIALLYTTAEGENIVANNLPWAPGDNVVIDELHYDSEFVIYRELEARRGVELRIAPHRDGAVTAADLEPLVDRRTRLVSVAWVSHQNGFCHEMRPITDLAHAHGALCYTDAVQAVGMFPVDVRAAGVDFLCCGTYKWLLSGFGVAPFFIRRDVLDRLGQDRFGEFGVAAFLPDHRHELHPNARRYDYASQAFGEVAMLNAALGYLEKVGVDQIGKHTLALGRRLHEGLSAQGHRMFTPAGNRSAIVTFVARRPAADVQAALRAAGLDVTVRDNGQVRVSPALFNLADEVDRFLEVSRTL
ncbi:MAG: aminotransferase class V-fold PLP-dependent enzyme [Gemmatimonadales bacterium]